MYVRLSKRQRRLYKWLDTVPRLRGSDRRNGRSRGGDTFDLEALAGGQTRWREQILMD